jgi:5-hydroxyisourate hydrolase
LSTVTTHVLDTSRGRPATGVTVRLAQVTDGGVDLRARASTDDDGRIADFGSVDLAPGYYRLVFETGAYFAAAGEETFYPSVSVDFEVSEPTAHYHVPLLVSPYGFTTYRGS